MDTSKLNGLSTEVLLKLKASIDQVLALRLDTSLRVGRVGEFEHPMGCHRKLLIERINGKTVSGTETGKSFEPGKKWRVGKSQLKVQPVERSAPLAPPVKPSAPHRPSGYRDGASW